MFIRMTVKRWLLNDITFSIPDATQYPAENLPRGFKKAARELFGDAYEKFGEPRDSADAAIDEFFSRLGDMSHDLTISIPPADLADDDFRILFEATTPETMERQSAILSEFLDSIPAPSAQVSQNILRRA